MILFMLVTGAFTLLIATEANVTGKWVGSFKSISPEGEARESAALLILKQTGSEISGSFGSNEAEQMPITKGRIEGDRITLVADSEGRAIHFDLVLAGDRIQGDVNMSHGAQIAKAKIDVKRASSQH
jgi:hypothetical protein